MTDAVSIYLEEHSIVNLLDGLANKLAASLPADPISFLINGLLEEAAARGQQTELVRRLLELRCSCSSGICGCTSFLRFLAQAFLFLPLADVHHLKRFSWWLRRSGSTFATIQSGILTFCSGHGTHRPWQDSLTAGG